MPYTQILADAYDRTKHIELTMAHGLPARDVLREVAALRAMLRPYRRMDAGGPAPFGSYNLLSNFNPT